MRGRYREKGRLLSCNQSERELIHTEFGPRRSNLVQSFLC